MILQINLPFFHEHHFISMQHDQVTIQ